jgi:hypothetical protein
MLQRFGAECLLTFSTIVGVLPPDTVVLLMDTDSILLHEWLTGRISDKAIKISNRAQAVTTQ